MYPSSNLRRPAVILSVVTFSGESERSRSLRLSAKFMLFVDTNRSRADHATSTAKSERVPWEPSGYTLAAKGGYWHQNRKRFDSHAFYTQYSKDAVTNDFNDKTCEYLSVLP